MLRLAKDHPYHTLYQLFALKNGDRGRDGKRIPAGGGGYMAGTTQAIDFDKVAAADSILSQYRSSSILRYGCRLSQNAWYLFSSFLY